MLDVVEDKAGFERLLQTLDVPAYSISSPICVGRIETARAAGRRRSALRAAPHRSAGEGHAAGTLSPDARDVRARGDAAPSIRQGGARRGRRRAAAGRSSPSSPPAGADFVQFDEPVLTELAFAPGRTRTFMCAALAARRDPAEELELRRLADQPRGRRRRRRADRRPRVPRQLEPRRDDAAERRLSGRSRRISSGCTSRSSCSSTRPSAPAH